MTWRVVADMLARAQVTLDPKASECNTSTQPQMLVLLKIADQLYVALNHISDKVTATLSSAAARTMVKATKLQVFV
jgi:hypothetical protein